MPTLIARSPPKLSDSGPPELETVTLAIALAMPGALAVMVAEPAATPVTVTVALVAPAVKLTVAGTVALLLSLELRFTVKPPAGACPPGRFSVRGSGLSGLIDNGDPVKLMVGEFTVTVPLPDVKPVADAVTVA